MRIDPAGWPFILPLVVAAILLGWLLHPAAGAAILPLVAFVVWFFRDPTRETPQDPRRWWSPADGRVIRVGPQRVSVFMNVFNVHVCRAPASGTVRTVTHVAGDFRAAFRDDAAEHNERVVIELDTDRGTLRVTLVAGLVARRIVPRVAVGQALSAGERIGLIRFGSRVDVQLPEGVRATVEEGRRVVAGLSPIAEAEPGAWDEPGDRGIVEP